VASVVTLSGAGTPHCLWYFTPKGLRVLRGPVGP
jgi:hypothetical protein